MERLGSLARRHALDVLIAGVAAEAAVEVAFRRGGQRPMWLAALAIALVVLPLLGRHRLPFAAPAATWLLAVAVSFADGQLVVTPVGAFIAAMIAPTGVTTSCPSAKETATASSQVAAGAANGRR